MTAISFLTSFTLSLLVNFHSLSFQDTDGNTISMSSFSNKKVMIVNIATGSNQATLQLGQLQQLQQQYADSLQIIVFPSNSFGNENRSNSEIKAFCQANFNSTFIIAAKSQVAGNSPNVIFDWLAKKSKNGEMDAVTVSDFEKYIITKDGMLVGVFASKIPPSDAEIATTINTVY